MLGISEIGKNNLNQGTKGMPAFGSAYSPSFGNTTYHDEFVSSHDNGVTAKQIGLFALVGLAVGAVVALAFKKPSAATTEAAEEVEKIVEYRLKDDSLLKAAGGAMVGGVKAVGRGIGAAGLGIGHGIAWTARKGAGAVAFPFKKIGAGVGYFGKEAKHGRALRAMEREAEIAAKAEELGIEPAIKGKAKAKATPGTPSPARAARAAVDTPPVDKIEHARKIHELKQELKEAEEAYEEKRGWKYRLNHCVDRKEPDRKGIKAIKAKLSEAENDAKKAGYKLKDLEKISPDDFTIEPLDPPAPAAPGSGPAPATPPAAPLAPAPVATTPPAPAVDLGGGI